jgi:hypothetical protein
VEGERKILAVDKDCREPRRALRGAPETRGRCPLDAGSECTAIRDPSDDRVVKRFAIKCVSIGYMRPISGRICRPYDVRIIATWRDRAYVKTHGDGGISYLKVYGYSGSR